MEPFSSSRSPGPRSFSSQPATNKGRPARIWVVEDDEGVCFVYAQVLSQPYRVRIFQELPAFVQAFVSVQPEECPDLIIADLRLKEKSFLTFLDQHQERLVGPEGQTIPLIVVSSIEDQDVLRHCFQKGAIDYMTKPFSTAELLVKLERAFETEDTGHGLRADPFTMTLTYGDLRSDPLTAREFQIVNILCRARGSGVARDSIVLEVWGNGQVTLKNFDVHLVSIRRKIARTGAEIVNVSPHEFVLTRSGESSEKLETPEEC